MRGSTSARPISGAKGQHRLRSTESASTGPVRVIRVGLDWAGQGHPSRPRLGRSRSTESASAEPVKVI